MTRKFDIPRAEAAMREFLLAMGEDLTDPNVEETPQRVTKMFSQELLSGHTTDPKITTFPTVTPTVRNMVIVNNLAVNSLCSHHLLPIFGVAHIGAVFLSRAPGEPSLVESPVPDPKTNNHDRIVDLPGLSKYARIVEKYSRRLQLQERLTSQIADAVIADLKADWVFVYMDAEHFCMRHRGVKLQNSATITTATLASDRLCDALAHNKERYFPEVNGDSREAVFQFLEVEFFRNLNQRVLR